MLRQNNLMVRRVTQVVKPGRKSERTRVLTTTEQASVVRSVGRSVTHRENQCSQFVLRSLLTKSCELSLPRFGFTTCDAAPKQIETAWSSAVVKRDR